MKIEKGVIKITNPYVIEFLTRHAENENLLKSCDNLLENYCKSANEFMEIHDKEERNKREVSSFITFLEEFERRNGERNSLLEKQFTDLSGTIIEKVSSQLLNILVSIDKTVTNNINETLKKGLKENDEEMKVNIERILTSNVKEPLQEITKQINDKTSIGSIIESVEKLEDKINDMLTQTLDKLQDTKEVNKEQINTIPLHIKGIFSDIVKELNDKQNNISTSVSNANIQLTSLQMQLKDNLENTTIIKSMTSDVKGKIEQNQMKEIKDKSNSKIKGTNAERILYELLCQTFYMKDGYDVEHVGSEDHSTDIVLRRNHYPTIRIESKTFEKLVPTRDVVKFQRDLKEQNNHGIFISLTSSIACMSNIEIQQVEKTGKFAIYLANNNYDVEIIKEMIELIYKLDIITKVDEDVVSDGSITLNKETIENISNYIRTYTTHINTIKLNLENSLKTLNEITFSQLEKLIGNEKVEMNSCEVCKEVFRRKSDLKEHQRICKSKEQNICPKCNKGFAKKNALSSHLKVCKIEPLPDIDDLLSEK